MPHTTQDINQHNVRLTDEIYHAVLDALKADEAALDDLLNPLHPADLADLIERLPHDKRESLAPHLPKDILGDVLLELDDSVQENFIPVLEPQAVADAVAEMESDDVVDIVQTLDEIQAEQTLEALHDQKQKKLAEYDPETAGGLMQLECLTAEQGWTVGDVFKYMRQHGDELPDNISTAFIIGPRRKLLGTVAVTRMARHALKTKLGDIMRTDPVTVRADTAQKEVAHLFEKYDLHNLAVVSHHGYLLGRITVDDALDVIVEEKEKEVLNLAGVGEGEDLFAPARQTVQHRLPWLMVNLFTAILASVVIAFFEDQIQRLVVLAVLMPIVASMGGNAGTQTLTVTVRGLATKQITLKNALFLLKKELKVGGFNGLLLGVLLAFGTILIYGDTALGGVILAATMINHLFAAAAGHLIPLLLEKSGKDPALSSGVLVTTVTDVGGFFVFLGLAAIFLL